MGVNRVVDGEQKPVTIERVEELFSFLQGNAVDGVTCKSMPRLSSRKAFSVIYFLQEHMDLIPDHFEVCTTCRCLFDTEQEGRFIERTCRHYCDGCEWGKR
jgi:hypothetical protein